MGAILFDRQSHPPHPPLPYPWRRLGISRPAVSHHKDHTMSLRFGVGQKAAARALLDLQCPTQSLVAACMGVSERSMTTWLGQFGWTYVDFRAADAREAQERHRRNLLRGHGRNVPETLRKLDFHEAVRQDELAALRQVEAEAAHNAALPSPSGQAGALLARIRGDAASLRAALMNQYATRGRALKLETLEASEVLVLMLDRLDGAMRADGARASAFVFSREGMEDEIVTRAVKMMQDPAALRGWAEGLYEDEGELATAIEALAAVLERGKR